VRRRFRDEARNEVRDQTRALWEQLMNTTKWPDSADEQAWQEAATALRGLARDRNARTAVRRSPTLAAALEAASRRFVAGAGREDALAVARDLNQQGILASVEFMGEDTTDPGEVDEAVREFTGLVSAISASRLRASISLNLSHIGLAVDRATAEANCAAIAAAAGAAGVEVVLNMEGDAYRDHILSVHADLGSRLPGLGITLQACLDQTDDDLDRCLELPGRTRLVKGAYDEIQRAAGIRGRSVDERYDRLAERLLSSDHPCAIATHDPERLHRAADILGRRSHRAAEFEMLLGVARDRLDHLNRQGFQTRVYVPYGDDWFLFLCHRVAEHPANLATAITAMAAQFQRTVGAPVRR